MKSSEVGTSRRMVQATGGVMGDGGAAPPEVSGRLEWGGAAFLKAALAAAWRRDCRGAEAGDQPAAIFHGFEKKSNTGWAPWQQGDGEEQNGALVCFGSRDLEYENKRSQA